jgi:hypothetical protein
MNVLNSEQQFSKKLGMLIPLRFIRTAQAG